MNGAWYGGDANAATWEVENCRVQWVQGAALMWFTPFSSHIGRRTISWMLTFRYQDGVSNQQKEQHRASRTFYGHAQEQLDREVKSREARLFGCVFTQWLNFGVATNMPLLGSKEISPLEG